MNETNPAPIRKTFIASGSVKALEDEPMVIDHAISDDGEDRDGDDITLDAWQTDNFMRNPVVLEAHNQMGLPVGKCIALYREGNQLRAKTQFANTERGKLLYELYRDGFMFGFSVGFMPTEYEPKGQRGYHFTGCELLEYSCVTVPANPRALKALEEAELKRGAVLSKSNLDKLQQAMSLIGEVIQSAEQTEEPENDPEPEEDDVKSLLYQAMLDTKLAGT